MAVYDGFFDAVMDEETGEYDRDYGPSDFTDYFANIIGSGVCVHNDPDSFLVRLEGGKAVVSPGYLFIQGYWLRNDADYTIELPGTGNYAIVAHLNLGARMIELEARSVAQAYPDSLVLAIVSPASAEDTRYNTDICGIIDTAGGLSGKVEWATNYIDNEIESKLAAVERDIAAQAAKLDAKIAEVQAVADSIVPPPIGSIKFSASQDVGEEWLRCDGSFVSETQYPELVAALGKLIPSGDKFRLISDSEVGPQISNGVVYGGRLWVYSYSTKKLYGIDLDGEQAVKEIAVTSEDATFSDFIAPSTANPLVLSIVPHKIGDGAAVFLSQIIKSESVTGETLQNWKSYFLIFSAEFFLASTSIAMIPAMSDISYVDQSRTSLYVSAAVAVPKVISRVSSGIERYACTIGYLHSYPSGVDYFLQAYLSWSIDGSGASVSSNGYFDMSNYFIHQRFAFSGKNFGESVSASLALRNSSLSQYGYQVYSNLEGTFNFSSEPFKLVSGDKYSGRENELPINVAGANYLVFAFDKDNISYVSTTSTKKGVTAVTGLPSAARVFPDAAAYLWGKDIYLIFVGTGIIFSRTLEEGSFGYLDTTSVLGTITQFGYLDYDQDEGTLYILGQDTTNKVKAAKIVLNTLYDYANDGAWLPMIAADGVPAYIKAVEAEVDAGPTVPMQVTVANGYSEYVSVLFNGEKLIPGTYTRMVSEIGKFSIGIRFEKEGTGSYIRTYYLKLNGANAVSITGSSGVGSVATESFYTQDYISGGITLMVSL